MGKIYTYYLREDDRGDPTNNPPLLYAWTENKAYHDRFCKERDMSNFHWIRKSTDKYEDDMLCLFRLQNKERQLIEIPITDCDGKNTTIIGTYLEDQNLTMAVEQIEEELDYLRYLIEDELYNKNNGIAFKFVRNMNAFLEYVKPIGEEDECPVHPEADINTLRLFMFLYHRTFYPKKMWESIEERDIALDFSDLYVPSN